MKINMYNVAEKWKVEQENKFEKWTKSYEIFYEILQKSLTISKSMKYDFFLPSLW